MQEQIVRLSVPPEAAYARTVRMMAANLAVVCDMSVDEVEDVRMAAEEGFVYSCATEPDTCDVAFTLSEGEIRIAFGLGEDEVDEDEGAQGLVELLLSAVCDEHGVSDDGSTLVLVKRTGRTDGE